MFLTDTELTGLTGRQRNQARVRVLNALGIMFKQRPDGTLAVLHQHVERLMDAAPAKHKSREWQPSWER